MASNPLGAARRRFNRAVEWRVRAAVDQRVVELVDDRSPVGAASILQNAINEATESFNRLPDSWSKTGDVTHVGSVAGS